mmetsp:Transcript_31465/g.98886  ORF Transcript_31465/g.98886 Transcript_31465/m.98886 type:complete len:334 (-) Transcript_31465:308-1309(-)
MASPLSLVSLQALVGIRVQPRFGSNSLRHPPAQCAAPRYVFDPLNLHSRPQPTSGTGLAAAALAGAAAPLLGGGRPAWAATDVNAAAIKDAISQAALDPATFQPVCPASDGLYRFSQKLVVAVVGGENYKEYAPLIAGGLLRVRLELCVVESFVYEAVLPFVKEKGLSWILPLHETVETFLAGVIFAVASNFILIGSTKLVTVVATYGDVLFGFPFRLVGGAGWRALEEKALPPAEPTPPPADAMGRFLKLFEKPPPKVEPPLEQVWKVNSENAAGVAAVVGFGALRAVGEASGGLRRGIEAVDFFVGRYLLLTTVGYVGLKFVHYKLFDPFP